MAYTFKHGDRPLEGYAIQRAVGRGGFGEVYYALSDGGREVALKYLRENPQIELRGVAHCINLKSPHLVSIFDVKKNEDGEYFVIMEYSGGPSLRDLLVAEPNGLGPQKAAFFLREIAKGLGYLHDRGIVHRDLKPGNIFYDEGYVKIGDYGLSKFISVSRHSAQTASVGTVHYMAPEVGSGNYHRGIDIYAMGVMLYEMLLGKVPFEGSSMGEVLMKHLTEQPEVDSLPQPFGKIIHKALQKDPKDRYQTIYEMIDDLMEVDDVRTSLAGFNPVSLSGAPRRIEPGIDSPAPSPNPAPRQVPVARKPTKAFNLDAGNLPPQMAKKINRTSGKVHKRMRKLGSNPGAQPLIPTTAVKHRNPEIVSDPPANRRELIQRAALASSMAVCLGFGLALVTDMKEEGFVSAIMLVGGVAGGLALGCRAFAHASRTRLQPPWVQRFYLTLPTAILIGLGSAPLWSVTRDRHMMPILLALWSLTLFGNWRKRIKSGSLGKLSVGNAFWAGLFALIANAIFSSGDERFMFYTAGIAAASSLVFEALSWLFPLRDWIEGHNPTGSYDSPPRGESYHGVQEQQPRSHKDRATQETIAVPHDHHAEHPHHFQSGMLEPASSFAMEHLPRRWSITRIGAALLGFACMVGLVGAIVYMFEGRATTELREFKDGIYTHSYIRAPLRPQELIPPVVLGAGCLGMMLLSFRKIGRYRTSGFYRDTLRPILMTGVLMGLAFGAVVHLSGNQPPHWVVPGRTILVVSLITLAFLMFVRGRRWHPSDQGGRSDDHSDDEHPLSNQSMERNP